MEMEASWDILLEKILQVVAAVEVSEKEISVLSNIKRLIIKYIFIGLHYNDFKNLSLKVI